MSAGVGRHRSASAGLLLRRPTSVGVGRRRPASGGVSRRRPASAGVGRRRSASVSVGRYWPASAGVGRLSSASNSVGRRRSACGRLRLRSSLRRPTCSPWVCPEGSTNDDSGRRKELRLDMSARSSVSAPGDGSGGTRGTVTNQSQISHKSVTNPVTNPVTNRRYRTFATLRIFKLKVKIN